MAVKISLPPQPALITPCLELNDGRSVSAGQTQRDSRAAVLLQQ